jgi:hypothetical protein
VFPGEIFGVQANKWKQKKDLAADTPPMPPPATRTSHSLIIRVFFASSKIY